MYTNGESKQTRSGLNKYRKHGRLSNQKKRANAMRRFMERNAEQNV